MVLRQRKRKKTRVRTGEKRTRLPWVEQLEPRRVLAPIISEFLASNTDEVNGLRDFEGTLQDWIEIHNPDDQAVDLTGWQLKDDNNTWTFPALSLGPGEFQIVFASDKNLTTPELHTNFKLSRDPGEYLGLLDDQGNVVHEYSSAYPSQQSDISYGIGQNIEETTLVSAGAQTRYLSPTTAALESTWMQLGFDDSSWSAGPTGLGFASLVPGFAVWNHKANISVSDLGVAETVLSTPSLQTAVYTETIDVVNYEDTGGGGHFKPDNPFPGMPDGVDHNDFVVLAQGIVHIPTTGDWTFGVNSDDGFRLRIIGATFDAAYGQSGTTISGDTLQYFSPRGPNDSFGVISGLTAGDYELELISYERAGGSDTELYAASGSVTAWSSDFRLIGDTANGGLAVSSQPFDGAGSSSVFASLIETDVKDAMQAAGNASLYSRITFDVADPESLRSLTLKMKYDDGYAAFLNGVEIARRNAPATIAYDSTATAERSDAEAVAFEYVDVSEHLDLLQATNNVLAVQAMNLSVMDGDLLVLPELSQIIYQGLEEHFFITPTPGAANTQEYWYRVSDTKFSVDRGFYAQPISVVISTDTPDATIRYSLNGTTPEEAENTKSVTSITRSDATATATIPNHGYSDGDLVLIRGANEPEYNGVWVISTVTADTFAFTVEGTPATPATGSIVAEANYYTYTGPITIDTTTTVRAAAFKTAYAPTDVDSQTYIFLDDVLQQPADPAGWPADWNGTAADYQMDPSIVYDPEYRDTLIAAMQSLPTMSISTDQANFFDPDTGIYANPRVEGWERPISLEYFDPTGSSGEFQVSAGVSIYGGVGRYPQFKKHSLRVVFKGIYGPGKLDFPLFGDQATDRFDTFILRANFNDGWAWGGTQAQLIRDQFADRSLLAMMSTASHGSFVHLYVNGMYWGVYNPVERPDASFAESYFGGDKEDWDGVNAGSPVSGGSLQPWYDLINFDFDNGSTEAYQRVQGNFPDGTDDPAVESLLDIPNYIDYMLVNFFVANADWPGHNWYAARPRGADSTGFKFFPWDTEMALGLAWIRSPGGDVTGVGGPDSNNPAEPYYWLSMNEDFRMLFADRAHKQLFHDGALTTDAAVARYEALADEVVAAIAAESARWGDVVSSVPYTPTDWLNERDWLLNTYLPQRNGALIQQLRNRGLYPDIEAATFFVNGEYQHGGTFQLGDALTMTAPEGTIYYSLDGSDPRLPGGAIRPGALVYSAPITLDTNTHVKSRVYLDGVWSAMNETTYYVDLAPAIRITELMYNPSAPTAAEIAAGFTNNDDFEFLEIKNIGTELLPLGGLHFSDGIEFTFPDGATIGPGEYRVIVRNQPAFLERYSSVDPGIIAGVYAGGLDNSGEQLELNAPVGGVIHLFDYKDGWYGHTDGDGFSLTIRDPLSPLTLWDARDGWRSSAAPGGTPGFDDTLTLPGSVIINEVLAHQDAPPEDIIELYNTTDQAIDVSGWFLSDAKDDLTKYQLAPNTWIAAHHYLVLTENDHFGVGSGDSGSHVPFALSEHGEDVYLSSNAVGAAGGYREHVDFGASPSGVSIGLYIKSTGGTDFALLDSPTFGAGPDYPGAPNSLPYRSPLVINEVMYHPPAATPDEVAAGYETNDFEYLEIYNRSGTTQTLRDFYIGDGIGFTFGWYDADGAGNEAWTLEPEATATWTNNSLTTDSYEVLVRYDLYDAEGQKRDLDDNAQYLVTWAGGTTLVTVDQDDDVFTYVDPEGWVSLGTYPFDGIGTVVLTRGNSGPNDWTIADQVKFKRSGHEVIVDDPLLASPWSSSGPTTLEPGAYLVLVKNDAAFDSRYQITANGINVAGLYSGNLGNNGDAIKLFELGAADPVSGYVPNYRVDYVNFKDHAPWPSEPDGTGSPLNRLDVNGYGNDPISWIAGGWPGTPGKPNVSIDKSAPSAPSDLSGHVTVDPDAITLSWTAAVDNDSYVDHYVVYRDGLALATSSTTSHVDDAVEPLVPYSYEVSAVNRDGYEGMRSAAAVVTVPGITNYGIPDASHIELFFSEALTPESASLLANYEFVGGVLSGADLSTDGLKVTLTTAEPLVLGDLYSVTIHNIATVSGNEMRDGLQIAFTYAPQGSGYIEREFWTGISGSAVSNLTSHPNFPDNITGKTYPSVFEGPVNWNDYYGTRMRGYVHPPETGEYTFWISSDDNSELWLSTDEDPANKVQIAGVPRWTGSREWTKYASQQSAPISLMVGRRYYIEVLAKEGAGGDNVAVRWQLPGGVWEDPQDPGAPIPGNRLSQWGPVPDTSAPTIPAGLSAEIISSTRVDLNWHEATDPESGVLHYLVYRDGQEIARTATASYSDTAAAPGVRHRYEVAAVNPFYFASGRSPAILLAPPGMVTAAATDDTTVQILFSEPMDRTLAEQTANYALSGNVTVTEAVLDDDRLTVTLTTSGMSLNTTYTVTVNNLETVQGVSLPVDHQTQFYYGNGILWEYWLNIGSGTAVADLTSNANYPYNPSGSELRSLFEARSNWANAYGGRMRGYLTPTETGNYWFWIASDNNGELWLSTDSDPQNKTRIANVPGWTSSRQWDKFTQQKSALIPLVAGTRYYIEALMKEGGGGDNLAVAWQREGTSFDELPIAGEFLTPYSEIVTLPSVPGVDVLVTNDATPLLSGPTDVGDVDVTVAVAGRYYAAIPNTSATWQLPNDVISPELDDGTYDVLVTITNASGRFAADVTTNELTVDTQPPVVTVDQLITDDARPQLTGTIDDPTAALQITVDGSVYVAVNHANGTWSLPAGTITPSLAANLYDIQAVGADAALNAGFDQTTDELLVVLHDPTDISLSNDQINENVDTSGGDYSVGILSAVDEDPVDYHTFELIDGTGDTDNALFLIADDQLKLRQGTVVDYETQSAYSVRISVSDAIGNRFEKIVAVGVTDLVEVSGVVVSDGTAARSSVNQVVVTIDDRIEMDPGAFEVRRLGAGGGLVDVSVFLQVMETYSVATLSFTGDYTRPSGSLTDGNYELRIHGSMIRSLGSGRLLDGDTDGTPGGDYVFGDQMIDEFFCFFGDSDGDRDVDNRDFLKFRQSFRQAFPDPAYRWDFDFDGDGDVDNRDFLRFRSRFRTNLPFE